ncbi:MAG: pyruvate dehydrogenase complex dihydrolipoamide acetyltransferase [Rhodothermales bacterium]
MAIPVEMPKMSDTMEEGVLVAWLAEEGASVSAGDVIAQVETDKATMDLEVYDNGVLLKRMVAEGDAVPIGALIAVLGKQGEDISAILSKYNGTAAAAPAPAQAEPAASAPAANGVAKAAATEAEGRVKASPLAKKLASSHGIDLGAIQGSGPEGRIVRRDIEAMVTTEPAAAPAERPAPQPASAPAASAPSAAPASGASYEAIKLSQMRKTITRRLAGSKFTAPHFYLTVDVAMENATAFRNQLNELAAAQNRSKVSFNDLVSKACALALRQHPYVNASYMEAEGEIRLHKVANIAVAVAVDEGLITPVIRNVDQKGLSQIAEETRSLAERGRDRKLQPEDYEGSTFTTSNLGMFGIEEFTAIINPPNACILAIGAIRDEAVVKNGEVVAGKRMKITLSCDHRVVDGATGAQFLNTVKQYLEEPMNLLL